MPPSHDLSRPVWAPDPESGFVLATLIDIGSNSVTVKRKDNGKEITASYDDVYAAEEDGGKDVDDNCALMYLNEGTLLNNCKIRYHKQKIYSYVANILISINPYEDIPGLYSTDTIQKYRGKSLGQLPPHIYAIADKAYRDMRRVKESQSIIVSGESGAGKTESQKAVLKYLCENWGSSAGPIQQRILETNPILEAFGNAKTLRNNNSSRFGKFVEIHFSPDGRVAGGFVSHYLLEKSRICQQSPGERSYHIFYQLIAGADKNCYERLRLAPPDKFNYLNRGCTSFFAGNDVIAKERLPAQAPLLRDPMVDDKADFLRLSHALEGAGLSQKQLDSIWDLVAAVLHLGNISFIENVDDMRGGCCVDPASNASVACAAALLGMEEAELRMGLVSRMMMTTRGGAMGTCIMVPLKSYESAAARDALAKAIYSRLFDSLVDRINKSINQSEDGGVTGGSHYIGVLDIAGFEFFAMNSFEQFCINYCNEKLQNFFNERILSQEQELYEKEGLNVPRIEYTDNQDCIDLFEKKGSGLLDLLDEEMRLPRAAAQHYTQAVHEANKGHFRLDTPRRSRLKAHRDMRDDEGLLVRHYAGTVCYHTQRFLEKNNDQLHESLEVLVQQSSMPLLCSLFPRSDSSIIGTPQKGGRAGPARKLQAASVGSKFRSQLNVLIEKLKNTGTHFVRCIKPNNSMQADRFDGPAILGQLQCAGMPSVLKLMQKGFPSRTSFAELYSMYQSMLPEELARLDPRLFCKCLFHALGLNTEDFKFGLTKVFFRPGKFAEFDQMLRQDPASMKQLITKVRSWLNKTRWRKAQYGAWMVIKLKKKIEYRAEKIRLIQAVARGYIARQQYKPRLALFRSVRNLLARSKEMTEVISGLRPASQEKWAEPVNKTYTYIQDLAANIKTGMDLDKAVKDYEECVRSVDETIRQLRQQVEVDEQEKLKELEQKRRDEEERQAREREEQERLEKERAARKAMEEEREKAERAWQEERRRQEELEKQQQEIEAKNRARVEQERLDAQVAAQIGKEDGRGMTDITPSSSMASSTSSNDKAKGKHDLSGWKYADLRDAINTSTDMELLLACKQEFHNRLKIYNLWQDRNRSSREPVAPPRLPLSVSNHANASRTAPIVNPALTMQRYFKVPFARPSDVYKNINTPLVHDVSQGAQNGLWYAHFNGQWIARQIELHPNKAPLLLTAGKDDLQMCELPLDHSGLTRKKGAEIMEGEFETVWTHYGGKPMARWNP